MDLEKVRQSLEETKAEIEARLARTHRHLFQKDQPVSANFSEQIKQTENDEVIAALEQEGLSELRQIDNALARIDAGEYEDCALCGNAIGEKRLEALPYTDRCIRCAEAE